MRTRKNMPLFLAVSLATGCLAKAPFDSAETDASSDDGAAASDGGSSADVAPASATDATASVDDASQGSQPDMDSTMPGNSSFDATGTSATNDGAKEAESEAAANVEMGRLMGITAAHNAVRAMVSTQPPLPPLVWSQTVADYAQQWATQLATNNCASPQHRSGAELQAMNYGENLATFEGGGFGGGTTDVSTAQKAVDAWAGEVACWTYGTISGGGPGGTEKCDSACYMAMNSDGCGHYTQIVWRKSLELGCGVATCKNGQATEDIWICNYAPAGNIIGQAPY
jgi:pathogenesis-related protein 1